MLHSINLCADEISVQVKRHRDKRRKRREARAAATPAVPPATGDVSPAA
jgi:putative sigma-54 modulation protein